MTKFGYHNGLVDEAYTDVMESICIMIDHAKVFHSSARTAESSVSRQRSPLAGQGIPKIEGFPLPFGLLPDNMENVHRPMTALATWNLGQAMPSQKFKSFGPIGLPSKRARVSSNLSSLVSSSKMNEAQNAPLSLKTGPGINPRETQLEISHIVDSQNANQKLSHAGHSTG